MTDTAPMKAAKNKNSLQLPEQDRLAVGDPVTHTLYTDASAHTVVSVSKNGRTAMVRACKAVLLNGSNSGEADALHFSPGGFCGHTSGEQRWEVTEDENGHVTTFTARPVTRKVVLEDEATGHAIRTPEGRLQYVPRTEWVWKLAGHPTHSPGNVLRRGHRPHYDFNF